MKLTNTSSILFICLLNNLSYVVAFAVAITQDAFNCTQVAFSIVTVGEEIIDGRLEELQRHLWVQLPITAACGVVVVIVVSTVDLTVVESLVDG